jgi:hypothetical protein
VLSTAWPVYETFNAEAILANMRGATVIDPGHFLEKTMSGDLRIRYASVGKPLPIATDSI